MRNLYKTVALTFALLFGLLLLTVPASASNNPANMPGILGIASLRLLPAASYPNVYLLGYRTINDGGQGTFTYTGSATCSDNAGTLIQAVGGCYQRETVNQQWSPNWFGAYGDNSHDDTSAFNAMYTALPSGTCTYYPALTYKVTGTVTVTASCNYFQGTQINQTTSGIATFQCSVSNVSFEGSQGAVINGSRTPSTGNDYVVSSRGIYCFGTSGTHIAHILARGIRFTNFKESAIWAQYCDECTFQLNDLLSLSYAGILCEVCARPNAEYNHCDSVSSSNGPANSSLPTGTKTNAYCITFTTDGLGNLSTDGVMAHNTCNNVPTWECFDTHAGQRIHFIGNLAQSSRVGIQITTDGGSIAPSGGEVLGNTINCIALNSPIYPGGPSSSVGGAGIYVAGVPSGALSTDIRVGSNVVSSCGSSETNTSANASIEVGDSQSFDVFNNHVTAGRFEGVIFYGTALGKATGNTFNSLVAGPIGKTPDLFDIATASAQVLLSDTWANSPSTYGYCTTAQSGGFVIGIARSNVLNNLTALYDPNSPCAGSTARVDLGATAP